jgi:hypothetical protein
VAIHYVDEKGQKGQVADRRALAEALRRGELGVGTRVYVPTRKKYRRLDEIFDAEGLREGRLERRAPRAKDPRSRGSGRPSRGVEKPQAPWRRALRKWVGRHLELLGVGAFTLAVMVAALVGAFEDHEREQRAAAERQQAASELAVVAEQMKKTIAPNAVATTSGAAAPPAPLPTPAVAPGSTTQALSDHLAEVRRLSDRYQQELGAVSDQLMTPESMVSDADRAANRTKLQKAKQITETFFAEMKQAKQRLLQQTEGKGDRAAERQQIAQVVSVLDRVRQANLRIYDDMLAMVDFADQHPPTFGDGGLQFESEPDVWQWMQLNKALERDRAQLHAVQEEAQKVEQQGLAQLQQEVQRLKSQR